MKRFLIASVATIGMAVLGVGSAQAGDCGCQCSTSVAYAPATSATVAQGQPATGYRSYSYQPTTGYNTYQPARSYRPTNRVGSGFHDAGWKVRGL